MKFSNLAPIFSLMIFSGCSGENNGQETSFNSDTGISSSYDSCVYSATINVNTTSDTNDVNVISFISLPVNNTSTPENYTETQIRQTNIGVQHLGYFINDCGVKMYYTFIIKYNSNTKKYDLTYLAGIT